MKTYAQCKLNITIIAKDELQQSIIGYEVSIDKQFGYGDALGQWTTVMNCNTTGHLHILASGFKPIDLDINVNAEDTTLIFNLERTRTTLDEIEVIAHKKEVNTTNTLTTINELEILSKSGLNLADLLSGVNGMNSIKTGNGIGKPMLQGMHSNRLLILNNGIRQEGQQWGMEHAPEIDPYIADNITVIKGAEAVRYGSDAIGGVILVQPSNVEHDKSIAGTAYINAQTNGRGGGVGVKLNGNINSLSGLQYGFHSSTKYLGTSSAAQYFLDNTGSREYNASFMLKYKREHADYNIFYSHNQSKLGILSSAHLGSREDLEYALTYGRPLTDGTFSYDILYPRQEISHGLLKADAHIHFTDFIHFHSIYGWQRNNRREYDKRRAGFSNTPSLNLNIHTHTWDNYLEYYDGYNWFLQGGVNLLYQQNYSAGNTFSVPLIPDYIKQEYGAFTMAKYAKGGSQFEAGIRYAYMILNALGYDIQGKAYGGTHNFNNYGWNIGYSYKPNNLWIYNTNIGSAFRTPSVNELYASGLHHGAAQMEYGDSSLKQEHSYKWIHSITYTPSNRLNIVIDGFVQYFRNYIYLQALGSYYSSLRGVFPEYKYTQADAYFYGADFSVKYQPLSWLVLQSNNSMTYAKKRNQDDFLPWIPPFNNRNEIQLLLKDKKWIKKPTISIHNINVAKQNRWSEANDYAPPPNGYTLWNVSYSQEWHLRNSKIITSIQVDNLFNKLYKDYLNRYRYFAHEMGRNIALRVAYQF